MGEPRSETLSISPRNLDVSPDGSRLEWEDPKTQTKYGVSTDSLVAILLPTPARESDSNADASLDDSTSSSLTALYLQRSQGSNNGGNGDADGNETRLDRVSIPRTLLDSPRAEGLRKSLFSRLPAHLDIGDEKDGTTTASVNSIHVVISTLSGTQQASPFFQNALKPLLDTINVSRYEVHETESATSITDLCETIFVPRAKRGGRQTIILLSGDGGVIEVIKAFADALDEKERSPAFVPPTLCVIPMGTGNATANSASSSPDSTLGLSALVHGTPRILPTFRVTLSPGAVHVMDEGRRRQPVDQRHGNEGVGHVYGAVVVSWGMHASLVADSDTAEYRKFGVDRFKMAAKELLWPSDGSQTHRYQGKVSLTVVKNDSTSNELETVDIERREHMYVLTTLVSQLEGGFTISPASRPLDGQLRIVHFGPVTSERAMELMGLAYQGGKHVEQPEVEYRAVEKVRIEFKEEDERWRRICVDGKIVAVPERGWLEVAKDDRHLVSLVAV
ncbi:hypothetical protein VTO42DRAFT_4114 [Malbranchea cinnamomea]